MVLLDWRFSEFKLLLFTMLLCVVLFEAGCNLTVENPELCWTWAFAVVAFVHNLPGVAVVKVCYDQFGTRHSKPTLFLHNLPGGLENKIS